MPSSLVGCETCEEFRETFKICTYFHLTTCSGNVSDIVSHHDDIVIYEILTSHLILIILTFKLKNKSYDILLI